MGVEVRTNAMVTNVEDGIVTVGQEKISAVVILWAPESRLRLWERCSAHPRTAPVA